MEKDLIYKIIQEEKFHLLYEFKYFEFDFLMKCNLFFEESLLTILISKCVLIEDAENLILHILKHGTNLYAIDNAGFNISHYASFYDMPYVLDYLCKKKFNMEKPDNFLRRPIHHACYSGSIQCVQILLENHVDIETMDDKIKTPLHYACESNKYEIAEILIKNGANVNIVTKKNQLIPALLAYNEPKITSLLIKSGADVEVTYSEGNKLIHLICSQKCNDYFLIAKYLIKIGVDPETENLKKQRPIHFALSNHTFFLPIIKLLVDGFYDETERVSEARQKIDLEAADSYGNTPLSLVESTLKDGSLSEHDLAVAKIVFEFIDKKIKLKYQTIFKE